MPLTCNQTTQKAILFCRHSFMQIKQIFGTDQNSGQNRMLAPSLKSLEYKERADQSPKGLIGTRWKPWTIGCVEQLAGSPDCKSGSSGHVGSNPTAPTRTLALSYIGYYARLSSGTTEFDSP